MTPQEIYKKELREFLNEENISEESIDRSVEVFMGIRETQHVTYKAMEVYGDQQYNEALLAAMNKILTLPLMERDAKFINLNIKELEK